MGTDSEKYVDELNDIQRKKEQFQKDLQEQKKFETEFENNFFNDMKEIEKIKAESEGDIKTLSILEECQATLSGIKKRIDAWSEDTQKSITSQLKQLDEDEIQFRYKINTEGENA